MAGALIIARDWFKSLVREDGGIGGSVVCFSHYRRSNATYQGVTGHELSFMLNGSRHPVMVGYGRHVLIESLYGGCVELPVPSRSIRRTLAHADCPLVSVADTSIQSHLEVTGLGASSLMSKTFMLTRSVTRLSASKNARRWSSMAEQLEHARFAGKGMDRFYSLAYAGENSNVLCDLTEIRNKPLARESA